MSGLIRVGVLGGLEDLVVFGFRGVVSRTLGCPIRILAAEL